MTAPVARLSVDARFGVVPDPLWQPRSDCGPECLPGPGATPRAGWPHRLVRLAALAGTLLVGAGLLVVLPVLPVAGRHAAGRGWARAVLAALGVRLVGTGRLPARRALLVANHISWLDILAILAVAPARLLAKHEVRRWPLIGWLAAAGGTIFVRRDRPLALPATVAEVAGALRAGGVVAVFPEGTTWCGQRAGSSRCGGAGRFRPAMFQAAVDADAPVIPLSITYRLLGGDRSAAAGPGVTGLAVTGLGATTAAAFLGRDSLWTSVRRVLAVRGLVVAVVAGQQVTAGPRLGPRLGRRVLAGLAESIVARSVPAPATSAPATAAPATSEPSTLAPSGPDATDPPLSEFSGTAQAVPSGAAHDGTHGGTADRSPAPRRGRRPEHPGTALRQPALRRLRRRHRDQRQRGR